MPHPISLDLKPWFVSLDELLAECSGTIDWPAYFGNDRPVELDVGCGRDRMRDHRPDVLHELDVDAHADDREHDVREHHRRVDVVQHAAGQIVPARAFGSGWLNQIGGVGPPRVPPNIAPPTKGSI